MLTIYDFRCEYLKNPIGIDCAAPRFSWKIKSDKRGAMQSHYQILVDTNSNFSAPIWDTGKCESEQSINHSYCGAELEPLTEYFCKVTIWDNEQSASEKLTFETGFLGKSNFNNSKWITADYLKIPPEKLPCLQMRKTFSIEKPIVKARLYATALGVYAPSLNGKPVDDTLLNPGWTSYNDWIQYQTVDVLNLLKQGENRLDVLLNEGWYNQGFTFDRRRNLFGDENALLLELHIYFDDGSRQIIATDETFKASTGPIICSDLYDGEIYDARLEDESCWKWSHVNVTEHNKDILTAAIGVPVRRLGEVAPIALIRTPKGGDVIDMGQNMVGFMRFKVKGEAGQQVILKHCEVLDADGNFYPDNIRTAKQEIVYTLKGGDEETFEPHFTYQGFRYVKIIAYPEPITLDCFIGIVVYSDMEKTGDFTCSDPLINRLQQNIVWGQKGNFVDIPTDCPQRDERLGWTADAQVFMQTASFNMNTARFITKWLKDLRAAQYKNGAVPFVVPDVLPRDWEFLEKWGVEHSSASWGDACTIVPWIIYQTFGDVRVLEESEASMVKWVEFMNRESGDSHIWRTGPQLGDWLALDAFEGSYLGATPTDFVATAHFAYSTKLLEKTCRILGRLDNAKKYADLYEQIVLAFRKEFIKDGHFTTDTQTTYILPLIFDLIDGDERKNAVSDLVSHLKKNGNHLTTGFVGTPYICHVLSQNGHADIAFDLLFQEDLPSWLYQIKKGATTIWEHWDGIKEDGSFWSPNMNSFNHYAYGSIGEWLYKVVAGINTHEDFAGYKKIVFTPHITSKLTWVNCSFESVYGKISSSWKCDEKTIEFVFTVPANTKAIAYLPCDNIGSITESGSAIANDSDFIITSTANGIICIELGAGEYLINAARN